MTWRTNIRHNRVRPPYRLLGALILWILCGSFAVAQTLEIEFSQGPFDQKRVRDAVFALADWQQQARRVGLDLRYVVVRHNDNEDWFDATPAGPEMARALLAEAGYLNGFPLPVIIFHDPSVGRLSVLMRRALSTVGIESDVQVVAPQDREAMIARTRYATGRERIEIPYIFLSTSRRAPPMVDVAPLPDLVVDLPKTRFDPDRQRLSVQLTLRNLGSGPAPPHRVTLYDHSGTFRGRDAAVPALDPRGSTAVQIDLPAQDEVLGRTVQLQAEADAGNTVRELNERNNVSDVLS